MTGTSRERSIRQKRESVKAKSGHRVLCSNILFSLQRRDWSEPPNPILVSLSSTIPHLSRLFRSLFRRSTTSRFSFSPCPLPSARLTRLSKYRPPASSTSFSSINAISARSTTRRPTSFVSRPPIVEPVLDHDQREKEGHQANSSSPSPLPIYSTSPDHKSGVDCVLQGLRLPVLFSVPTSSPPLPFPSEPRRRRPSTFDSLSIIDTSSLTDPQRPFLAILSRESLSRSRRDPRKKERIVFIKPTDLFSPTSLHPSASFLVLTARPRLARDSSQRGRRPSLFGTGQREDTAPRSIFILL